MCLKPEARGRWLPQAESAVYDSCGLCFPADRMRRPGIYLCSAERSSIHRMRDHLKRFTFVLSWVHVLVYDG